jgi:predicted SnoaL-like aldol condensation-catalyzing enzyme
MKAARSIHVAAGLIVGLAIGGPAWARDCSPSVTMANEKLIGAFANAAMNDYKLGDRAAASLRDRADKFMTPRYLQHHPGVESGREAFINFHVKWYRDHPPQPPQPTAAHRSDTVVAHCDLVLYMHNIPRPDPGDPGKVYDSYLFDLWRVRNGKADEHWDSFQELWRQAAAGDHDPEGQTAAVAAADPSNAPASAPAADRPSKAESCSATQIADNRRLLRRLEHARQNHAALLAGAESMVAMDYVEHNPLLADQQYQGRAGFVRAVETRPQTIPGVEFRYGAPELAFADCSHLATVKTIVRDDYARPKATYEAYWFDLWRINDGQLTEHWDAALKDADYHWDDVDSLNRRH